MTDFCTHVQMLGKGISSASRFKILEVLMDGSKTVNEIVAAVNLSQPAVSQHLATLKSCELVTSSKKGQEVEYSLNARHMLEVLKDLTSDVSKCKKTPLEVAN